MSRLVKHDKRHKSGYQIPSDYSNYHADVFIKLGKLEDLEDEFSCPLRVVSKALKEGIYFNFNMMLKEKFIEPTNLSLKFSLGGFYCLYFEQWGVSYEIDLKDYGKTWWLKEDRPE